MHLPKLAWRQVGIRDKRVIPVREFSPCKPKQKSFWGAFLQKGALVL
jgi:hypothetical protein